MTPRVRSFDEIRADIARVDRNINRLRQENCNCLVTMGVVLAAAFVLLLVFGVIK